MTTNKYPKMDKIIRVLKYLLKLKDLNESFKGGLSSYMLFNLVFIFFQNFKESNNLTSDSEFKNICLGTLFFEFLNFWLNFDYENIGLKVDDKIKYFGKWDIDNNEFVAKNHYKIYYRKWLCILDKFQNDFNVIQSKTDIPKILEFFKKILNSFENIIEENPPANFLIKIIDSIEI